MSARDLTANEKRAAAETADDIFDLLRELPYPTHAAIALSVAHARLIHEAAEPTIDTEAGVRKAMAEMTEAIIGNWKEIQRAGRLQS